ncbi:MAG: N-acetylneuraminate synthase family protein [Bacteroidota bacterium]|nr:N-acetylneuraminate synthase family protein [Bacteroidota bacterium]
MNQVSEYLRLQKCFIIAEVAQSHDGSLGMAHSFIDAAASCGADAIKFQTHFADQESTLSEPWRVKFSYEDDTRFEYWQRMEFTPEQWFGLKDHADEKGIMFLSSPFSIKAVELLERMDMEAWKIASGELSNAPMLERIYTTSKPVIISSGMSQLSELDELIDTLKTHKLEHAILQCTTAYPTPPEKIGLNNLALFRDRYQCPVGLSDHSGEIYSGLAAVALGAKILEVHLALSKAMFGPDVVASLDIPQLTELVKGVRFIESALSNDIDKDAFAETMKPLKNIFTKSIVAQREIQQGEVLKLEDLGFKKPGTGMPASDYINIIGKKLNKTVKFDHFFTDGDFE